MRTNSEISHSLAVICVAGGLLLAPAATTAAVLTVDTLVDADVGSDGHCSLREAIEAANGDTAYHECAAGSGADVVEFAVNGTVTLNADLQEISDSLTVQGPGTDLLTIDGGLQFRAFSFDAPGAGLLEVSDLTITRAFGGFGAAVSAALDDSVTLTRVSITDGRATFGGALYASQAGDLRIVDSELSGNRGDSGGGGLWINAAASLYVSGSTIAENFAGPPASAADANGGGMVLAGTNFEIRRSTISGNGARGHGGGLYLVISDGLIRNSTIVDNFADSDGDGHSGGGIRIEGAATTDLRLGGTIVGDNSDGSALPDDHPDISLALGTVTSLSFNWISVNASVEASFPPPATIGDPNLNDDFVGTAADPADPHLDALGDWGGPTRTHRPLAASGVIDQGDCPVAAQDQRGFGNPLTGRRIVDVPAIPNLSDGCDIGAVESLALPLDGLPFLDGFEDGSTSRWSSTIP